MAVPLFFRRKGCRQFSSDGLSYLALDREDIGKIPIKTIRPNGFILESINQLGADPDPVSIAANGSF